MLTVLYNGAVVWSVLEWKAETVSSDLSETVVPFIQGNIFETAILLGFNMFWSRDSSKTRSLSMRMKGSWMISRAIHSE